MTDTLPDGEGRPQLWTASEAARATGGERRGDWIATGVSIDTRTLVPGDLFVALSAARDGHDFVAQAFKKGACAAMVTHIPEGVGPDNYLIVDEVLPALERLGAAARARTDARIVAITGSVGKTTAKEMMRAALKEQGKTHASVASYNNHWGVPLTLARMPQDTEFAVIEIGMSNPGEIAPLAKLARPHVALITTIAPAHLEAFGRIEGIAEEKASIFEGLEPQGAAIIPVDVSTAQILRDKARACAASVQEFTPPAQVTISEESTSFSYEIGDESGELRLAVSGRHFAGNAIGVLHAATALGAELPALIAGLERWSPVKGRGQREALTYEAIAPDHITLIDDAFNANPTSMKAGLEVLATLSPHNEGRRIAVLGDMLELGDQAAQMHAEIASFDAMKQIDRVYACGPLMAELFAALPPEKRGQHMDGADELAAALPAELRGGDLVLVKGSKGSKVSLVVDALRKTGQSAASKERGQG